MTFLKYLSVPALAVATFTPGVAQELIPDYKVKTFGAIEAKAITDGDGNLFLYGNIDDFEGAGVGLILKLDAQGHKMPFAKVNGHSRVKDARVLPDGKILFNTFATSTSVSSASNLIRLNSDGSIDDSFQSEVSNVERFEIQSNSSIIVFSNRHFYRLMPDGTLDHSFNSGKDVPLAPVFCIGADDGIYYSWLRTIYKLTPDGVVDTNFTTGTVDNDVLVMRPDSNGKILIGGNFTTYGGAAYRSIARINTSGLPDDTFIVGTGAAGGISAILERPNGNLVVGGSFNYYNSTITNLVELNASGAMIQQIAQLNLNSIASIVEDAAGRIVIVGSFQKVNSTNRFGIARFNTDYSLDDSYTPLVSFNDSSLRSIVVNPDGSIYLTSQFGSLGAFDGAVPVVSRVTKVDASGQVMTDFAPYFNDANNWGGVYAAVAGDNNKLIISGLFGEGWQVVRLNTDGSKDATFSDGTPSTPPTFMLRREDEVLLGGSFISYNGIPAHGLIGISADGAIIQSFDALPEGSSVWRASYQSDGKLVLLGYFPFDSGVNHLIRLDELGNIDATFNDISFLGNFSDMDIDVDDNIYIAGLVLNTKTFKAQGLLKLDANGTPYPAFTPWNALSPVSFVSSVKAISGDRIAIGGGFNGVHDFESPGFAIIDGNGNYVLTKDPLFERQSVAYDIEKLGNELFISGILVTAGFEEVYGVRKLDLTPAGLPSQLVLEASLENDSASLTWTAPFDDALYTIIEASTDDQAYVAIDTVATQASATWQLQPNHLYKFKARAFNYAGFSAYSSVDTIRFFPVPTGDISLTTESLDTTQVKLAWNSGLNFNDGFIVQRSTEGAANFLSLDTLSNTAVEFADPIERNIPYTYRLIAFNQNGSIESNHAEFEWRPLPGGMLTVSVSAESDEVAKVSWSGLAYYCDGLIIQRSLSGNEFVVLDTVDVGSSEYVDVAPVQGSIVYRVSAYNENGVTPFDSDPFEWTITALESSLRGPGLWPVPCQARLNVTLDDSRGVSEWKIVSSTGVQLHLSAEWHEGTLIVNTESLPAGLYNLHVYGRRGTVRRRFVKQ